MFPQNLFNILLQIMAYKEPPVAAAQKINLFLIEFEGIHWVKVGTDSRIFSTQAWKNKKKFSLLEDIDEKNSRYLLRYLRIGCAVNDFQVTIALQQSPAGNTSKMLKWNINSG